MGVVTILSRLDKEVLIDMVIFVERAEGSIDINMQVSERRIF